MEMKNTGKIAFLYIEKFVFYLTKKMYLAPNEYTYTLLEDCWTIWR